MGMEPAPLVCYESAQARRRSSRPSAASPAPLASTVALQLSSLPYALCWWLILLVHAAHAMLLLRAVLSLLATLMRPLTVTSLLQAVGVAFDPRISTLSLTGAALFALCHAIEITRMVLASIHARQLTLVAYTLLQEPRPPRSPSFSIAQRLLYFLRYVRWLGTTTSPYFEVVYHLKELTEIALQTAQALRVSYSIAHAYANQLTAAVITLNCWSSPLLNWLFAHSFAKRRVACLVVDVVLDFTSSMALPVSLYAAYKHQIAANPTRDMFDPVWAHYVGNDLQQFTNMSLFDVAFRALAALSMLLSLRTIQALVRRRSLGCTRRATAPNPAAIAPLPGDRGHPHAASDRKLLPASLELPLLLPLCHPKRRLRWLLVLVHVLLFVYGAGVGLVYRTAAARVPATRVLPGCHLVMRQWFATGLPCAILEINCHARELTGTARELTDSLTQIDRRALSALTISHCQGVHMPPAMLAFPNLVWLEIYNSTLVDWPATATPTQTAMPKLSRLLFVDMIFPSLAALPPGLIPTRNKGVAFPASLQELVFVRTQIPTWPVDLSAHWDPQYVRSVILEDCGLISVPPQLAQLQLKLLSLAYNEIHELPAWLFTSSATYTLFSVAGNPIVALPAAIPRENSSIFEPLVGKTTHIHGVFVENTNLRTLPLWAIDVGLCTSVAISAGGSPFCGHQLPLCAADAVHCDEPSTSSSTISPRSEGRLFPMDAHEKRRQP